MRLRKKNNATPKKALFNKLQAKNKMKPEPLKNKEAREKLLKSVLGKENWTQEEINHTLPKQGDGIFREQDILSAVTWLKQNLQGKIGGLPIGIILHSKSEVDKGELLDLIDEAFQDVVKK